MEIPVRCRWMGAQPPHFCARVDTGPVDGLWTWHVRREMRARGCSGVRSWTAASDARQEPSLIDCFRRLYGADDKPIPAT